MPSTTSPAPWTFSARCKIFPVFLLPELKKWSRNINSVAGKASEPSQERTAAVLSRTYCRQPSQASSRLPASNRAFNLLTRPVQCRRKCRKLPLAALVGGGKAGNAQGIRPGNTAVFKPEDSRGHLSFCSIHWLESWFPWSKRQWRRIQGGKRLAEAALSPTEPSSRSGNDPSLPEVDGDARGWNGLLPDVVSALLPAAAAFRRRYEWMMNVQKRHAGNSWERVMAHAS